MKKGVVLLVALAYVFMGAGAVLAGEHVISNQAAPYYLYVLSAKSGTFDGKVLSLEGLSPSVVYFSDRPYRIAGHMLLGKFIGRWNQGQDSFMSDPPNVALSILSEAGTRNVVVELTDLELEKNTLQGNIRVIDGELPDSFGIVSMFIDHDNGTPFW